MTCLDQTKLLYLFPVISLNFGSKAPAIIYPIFTIMVLYALTFLYSKYMVCGCPSSKDNKLCCRNYSNKDLFVKSLAPLSVFMALGRLMYLSMFVKIPIITGANMILNNMITWVFLWGWLYKKLYEKMFYQKCE